MSFRHAAIPFIAALFLVPALVLADEVRIEVGHGNFEPSEVSIDAGTTVEFENVVDMPGGHTVVIHELEVESGALGTGETWSHTFDEAGTYHVYVKEHADADKARVVVN